MFDYLIIPSSTVEYRLEHCRVAPPAPLRERNRRHHTSQSIRARTKLPMLLLARYAAQHASFAPHVRLRYSGADHIVTAYENRPMTEMVKAHLRSSWAVWSVTIPLRLTSRCS